MYLYHSISYTIYNISICVPSLLWRKTWRPKPEMDNNPRYTLAIIPCCVFLHLLRVRQLWPARWDGRGIWGIRRIRRVWIEKKGRRRSLSRTQMETAHLASGSERSGPKFRKTKKVQGKWLRKYVEVGSYVAFCPRALESCQEKTIQ